jgi:hypothetical protein
MSLRIARPTLARQAFVNLTSRTSRSSLPCITSSALHTQKDQVHARPLQRQQRRTFLTTSIRTHEMSQGSHPHLKIAELFDVSGLTVAVTVSSMNSWSDLRPGPVCVSAKPYPNSHVVMMNIAGRRDRDRPDDHPRHDRKRCQGLCDRSTP